MSRSTNRLKCLSLTFAYDNERAWLSFVAALENGEYGEHFSLEFSGPAQVALLHKQTAPYVCDGKITLGKPID